MGFSGYVKSIPLLIEDKESSNVFKTSKLYIHSFQQKDSKQDEKLNLSITGMSQEGVFSCNINESNYDKLRKNLKNSSSMDWKDILINQFNAAYIQSQVEVQMEARLSTLRSNYNPKTLDLIDGAEGEMDDFLIIEVKTTGKLPITLGSIKLLLLDESEEELNSDMNEEVNLFNWIDLLIDNNYKLNDKLESIQHKNEVLIENNRNLKRSYDSCKRDYDVILEDLQDKFYQVLNAKKDKIWELQMVIRQLEGKESDAKRPKHGVKNEPTSTASSNVMLNRPEKLSNLDSNTVKTEKELVDTLLGRVDKPSKEEMGVKKEDNGNAVKTSSTSTVRDDSPKNNTSFVSTGTDVIDDKTDRTSFIKQELESDEIQNHSPNENANDDIKKEASSDPVSPDAMNEDTDYSSDESETSGSPKGTQIQSGADTDYSSN